jgi:acyl-coenzyme A thioesterase PaaI-like protein
MEALASLTVLGDLNSLPPKPVNLTVDYLRPGLPGTLNARASILRRGRRIASVETTAWLDDAEKPVAKGLFHFLLV